MVKINGRQYGANEVETFPMGQKLRKQKKNKEAKKPEWGGYY